MAYNNLIISATQAALAELHKQADSVDNLYVDPVMAPERGLLVDGDINLYRLVMAVQKILQSRRILPTRRESETITFNLGGMEYIAQVSFFRPNQPAEIFLHAGKPGTDINTASRDIGIAASLALQYRCPPEVLLKALTQSPTPSGAGLVHDGPLGVALTKIMETL